MTLPPPQDPYGPPPQGGGAPSWGAQPQGYSGQYGPPPQQQPPAASPSVQPTIPVPNTQKRILNPVNEGLTAGINEKISINKTAFHIIRKLKAL